MSFEAARAQLERCGLADRILELTKVVSQREARQQYLDKMDLERERGITIKAQTVRIPYVAADGQEYELNLIDTPGHVDFNYEVSRSLAACEGALLVVDATQGVEAQTLANVYLALDHDHEIVPVLNKIDLPSAEVDRVKAEIEDAIGLDCSEALPVSAKTGMGVPDVLEAIVHRLPAPQGREDGPLKALIFDSWYDSYQGVVVLFRIVDGTVKLGDRIRLMSTGKEYDVLATDDTAYLGDLQRSMDITVLSDSQYEELRPCGSEMKIYNFKIADSDNPKNVDASADYIRSLSQQLEDGSYVVGSNIIYPESNEDSYIRVAYSICVFMFVTLILAAGSIIFLKVGNDAREDRERYTILKKIGISEKVLWRSAGKELSFTYYCPFVLMAVSSIFAIRALGSVMREDLTYVNVISALSILILFTLIYLISLRNYGKLAIERRYGYKS